MIKHQQNMKKYRPFISTNKFVKFQVKDLSRFVRILLWLFSGKEYRVEVFKMIASFHVMSKWNGNVFLVNYLKEAHRLSLKALAGTPETSLGIPRVATIRGLPQIIPGPLRVAMERRDEVVIKLVLSVITVYRILNITGTLTLNTITDVFTGKATTLPKWEVDQSLIRIKARLTFVLVKSTILLPAVSAGPNSKISILGAPLDAWAFRGSYIGR